jgi:hypothetical protein
MKKRQVETCGKTLLRVMYDLILVIQFTIHFYEQESLQIYTFALRIMTYGKSSFSEVFRTHVMVPPLRSFHFPMNFGEHQRNTLYSLDHFQNRNGFRKALEVELRTPSGVLYSMSATKTKGKSFEAPNGRSLDLSEFGRIV